MEHEKKPINIANPIEGKLTQITKYFVDFYGEKYRKKIEDKISKTVFLFLRGNTEELTGQVNNYIGSQIDFLKDNYCQEIYSKWGIKIDISNYAPSNFQRVLLGLKNENYSDFIKNKSYLIEPLIDKLCLDKDLSLDMDELNTEQRCNLVLIENNKMQELILQLEQLANLWEGKYLNEYKRLKNEEKELLSQISKLPKDKKDEFIIEEEYSQKKEDVYKRHLLKYFSTKQFTTENLDNVFYNEFPKLSYYDVFDDLQDFLDKDEKFFSDFDKQKYIKMFDALGFSLGNDFENYMKNSQILNFKNDKNLKNEISILELEQRKELALNNADFIKSKEILENENITYNVNDFYASVYNYLFNNVTNVGGYTGAFVDKDANLKTLCVCPKYFDLDTETFIHELNHVLSFSRNDKENAAFGFQKVKIAFYKEDYDINKVIKKYSFAHGRGESMAWFNEVINDYISIKISQNMRADGLVIGDKEYQKSSYCNGFPLLGKFIENNIEQLKESYMSKDADKTLESYIGKENFRQIIQLTEKFHKFGYEYIKDKYKECSEYLGCNLENCYKFLQSGDLNQKWPKSLNNFINVFKKMREIENNIEDYKFQNMQLDIE